MATPKGISFSGNNEMHIDAWEEREGLTSIILTEWIAKHGAKKSAAKRYVDGQDRDAFLWEKELHEGHMTQDDYFEYLDWMDQRSTYNVNRYIVESEESREDAKLIYWLHVCANLPKPEGYHRRAALLIERGYTQAAIDSVPLLTPEEDKQRKTNASPLKSNSEWMTKEERQSWESEHDDKLMSAPWHVKDWYEKDYMSECNAAWYILTFIPPTTHLLELDESANTLRYAAVPVWSQSQIQARKDEIMKGAQIAEEEAIKEVVYRVGFWYTRRNETKQVGRIRYWLGHQLGNTVYYDTDGNQMPMLDSDYGGWELAEV